MPIPLRNDIPVDGFQVLEIIVPLRKTGQTMSIGKHELVSILRNGLNAAYEINERLLPFVITLHPSSLQIQEHNRQWAEVKGHIIMRCATWSARNLFEVTIGLNTHIVNRAIQQTIIGRHVWRIQSTSRHQSSQTTLMHDAVNHCRRCMTRFWHC